MRTFIVLVVSIVIAVMIISAKGFVLSSKMRSKSRQRPHMHMHLPLPLSSSPFLATAGFLIAEEQAKVMPYERGEMPGWVIPIIFSLVVGTVALPQIARKVQVAKNSRNLTDLPPLDGM